MELEEFDRFEDGFLNVPIPNYSAVYRIDRKLRTWKNYILILIELEELYFDCHGIGRIRGWVLEFFQFQIIPRYIESIKNFERGKIIF